MIICNRDMDQALYTLGASPLRSLLFGTSAHQGIKPSWTGNISLSEDEERIYFEANAPGARAEEIDVTFEKGILRVETKTRKREQAGDDTRKHYYQRMAHFSYAVPIPAAVDPNAQPEAEYKDGVIRIAFAKKREEIPQKIDLRSH